MTTNEEDIVIDTIRACKRKNYEFTEILDLLIPRAVSGDEFELSTDGELLLYSPSNVLKTLEKSGRSALMHQLMHVVLHLLFDDPVTYMGTRDKKLFGAYADLRCEILLYYLDECDSRSYQGHFEMRAAMKRYQYFEKFVSGDRVFPKSYYNLVLDEWMSEMVRECGIKCDQHRFWLKSDKEETKKITERWEDVRRAILGEAVDSSGEEWCYSSIRNIKERFGENLWINDWYGNEQGDNRCLYRADFRSPLYYTDVLKDFLIEKEGSKEDPESIDRMMYSYGFDLYGDVALIEPSEDSTRKTLGTIGIALDTSGSCIGQPMSVFLRELSGILRDISENYDIDRIIVYQCDYAIQKKDIYEDVSDLPDYLDEMECHGFGGTSFVPVIEDLSGEKSKVEALFYLTDGFGSYPDTIPDYPVFFIIQRDRPNTSFNIIPDWVRVLEVESGERNKYDAG